MSSLLGPVTDADLRRWQRRRSELLDELIAFGEQRELPPLTWTLGVHTLIGAAGGHHDNERRDTFEDWVTALELEPWEQRYETGRTHLHADTKDLWGRGVGVTVLADLWDDDPAE